jgi:hypothetical protein
MAAMIPAIPAKEVPTCMLLEAPDLADPVLVELAAEPVAEPVAEPEVATDPLLEPMHFVSLVIK